MPSSERCEGCGAGPAEPHQDQCPAVTVTVIDKRGARPKDEGELEQAVLEAQIALEQLSKDEPEGEPDNVTRIVLPGEDEKIEGTWRQHRIEELRAIGQESQLTAEEAGELLRLQAAEEQGLDEEAQVTPALTAFLVIVGHDGSVVANPDVNLLMSLDRLATIDDMDSACAVVRRDVQASMTAKQVVFGLQVSAQAMAEKRQALDMASRLGHPTGMRRR